MAAKDAKEQELWARFAIAAMQSYSPEFEAETEDEIVDSMVVIAANFADAMLDEMDERYGGGRGARRPKKSSKRKRREEVEDDDDEDLDDEDDD